MSSPISIEQALVNHARLPARQTRRLLFSRLFLPSETTSVLENSQLWNHLREQRHNYSFASNDVKRSRAERDQLRAKPETLTKGKEVSDDKNLNASTSASSGPGRSDEANRDASNDVSGKPSESSSSSRARPTRHHSEGTPGMHFVPETHIAR